LAATSGRLRVRSGIGVGQAQRAWTLASRRRSAILPTRRSSGPTSGRRNRSPGTRKLPEERHPAALAVRRGRDTAERPELVASTVRELSRAT